MDWPETPVERIPPREFVPSHCPLSDCAAHTNRGLSFTRHSSYVRQCDGRRVFRFYCRSCKRTFSQQAFACSYYLKRPELLPKIAAGLLAGSAHRQIARSLGCAPSTVTRLAARLGRHSLLLLASALEQIDEITEPVVYDDFESFFLSQDLPCGLGTPVGQDSWFVYGLEQAPHRRGPRRAARKARPAHAPPAIDPGSYRRAFQRTLDLLAEKRPSSGHIELISDEHPGYRAGMKGHPARSAFEHRVFPNPKKRPSEEATRRDRAMFAVDLLHGLLRHSLAGHHRETIAFGRRLNALMERLFLAAVWRNWVKGRSERRPDPTTPAMTLGLTRAPWTWPRVLARRLFPKKIRVPGPWMTIYRRELITPQIGINTRHRLIRAF